MYDTSHILYAFWALLIVLVIINGSLSISLVIKQHNTDIPLIIFSVAEFSTGAITLLSLLQWNHSKTSAIDSKCRIGEENVKDKARLPILAACNSFTVVVSTALWIYWSDNIIYQEETLVRNIYFRKLRLVFTTFFTISLLFKMLIFVQLTRNFSFQRHRDLENAQTESDINIEQEKNYHFDLVPFYFNEIPKSLATMHNSSKQSTLLYSSSIADSSSANKIGNNNQFANAKEALVEPTESLRHDQCSDNDKNEINNHLNPLQNFKMLKLFNTQNSSDFIGSSDIVPNSTHQNQQKLNFTPSQIMSFDISHLNSNSKPVQAHINMDKENHLCQYLNEVPVNYQNPSATAKFDTINCDISDVEFSMDSFLSQRNNINDQTNNPYAYHKNNSNFLIDNNEVFTENNIQMLNISEPLRDQSKNPLFNDIYDGENDLSTIHIPDSPTPSRQRILEQIGYPLGDDDYDEIGVDIDLDDIENDKNYLQYNGNQPNQMACQIQPLLEEGFQECSYLGESDNCFLDDLNKEILENGSGNPRNRILVKQSMPNLPSASFSVIKNNTISKKPSFTRKLRNSISASNFSALTYSRSPLKQFSNTTQIADTKDIDASIKSKKSLLLSTIQNNNKVNSIPSSPQVSLSDNRFKSISSSRSSRSRSKSQSPLKKLKHFKDSLQLSTKDGEEIRKMRKNSISNSEEFQLDLNIANSIRNSPIRRKQSIKSIRKRSNSSSSHIPDLVSPLAVAQLFKEKRVTSDNDRSIITNSSVPSGYYGEYDKEKWRVFKKVHEITK